MNYSCEINSSNIFTRRFRKQKSRKTHARTARVPQRQRVVGSSTPSWTTSFYPIILHYIKPMKACDFLRNLQSISPPSKPLDCFSADLEVVFLWHGLALSDPSNWFVDQREALAVLKHHGGLLCACNVWEQRSDCSPPGPWLAGQLGVDIRFEDA